MKSFKVPSSVVEELISQFSLETGLRIILKGGAAKAIAVKSANLLGFHSFLLGAPSLQRLFPIHDLDGWVKRQDDSSWGSSQLGDLWMTKRLPKVNHFPLMWDGFLQSRSGIDNNMAKLYVLLNTSSLEGTVYYSDSFSWDLSPIFIDVESLTQGQDSKEAKEKKWERRLKREILSWYEQEKRELRSKKRNKNWRISNSFYSLFLSLNPFSNSFFDDLEKGIWFEDDKYLLSYLLNEFNKLYDLYNTMEKFDYVDPCARIGRYLAFSFRYNFKINKEVIKGINNRNCYWIINYALYKSKDEEEFSRWIMERIYIFEKEEVKNEVKEVIERYLKEEDNPYWDKAAQWDKNNGW
jgi:hypothetical protein